MGADLVDSHGDRLSFLLFGDQSLDCHGFLVHFFRQDNRGELANAFVRQVCRALKKDVETLPASQRTHIPEFRTLQQLNQKYHASKLKHAGIDSALLAASQIAHFLDHAEKHCEDISPPECTRLVGLCSGLWAASAIAVSPSLPDLVHIGAQTVLLAFKVGQYVHEVGQRLNPTAAAGHSESWTYLFTGLDLERTNAHLDAFNTSYAVPPLNRAYVSAVAPNSIAVSGPPTTLRALIGQGHPGQKAVALPVYGPYHAPHIHCSTDVGAILGLDDPAVKDAFYKARPRSPVMSCSTASWFPAADTKSLMISVASTILNETLMFPKVVDTCVETALQFYGKRCLILPLGPTQNATTLQNRLMNETKLQVEHRVSPLLLAGCPSPGVGNHGSSGRCKLAIVGMAGRFPDAASHEKLWELLAKGLDVHRLVPPDRFDYRTHCDPNRPNTSHTPYGCWIEDPGLFDPRFFQMSPREARQTDPMQRMALITAYEALEMSGFVPNRTPSTRLDRIGTFYGQTSDDWREINAAQDVDTYFITGGVRAFGPGRINFHFGFSGPSLNIDTACSSSAAAMQVACTALWAHDCDTAVVGGLSCMTNPDIFSGLSKGSFLSKKGPCATFDDGADGYCRGDGCASVIVKRLDDALADHDRILGVILGTATNHSADAISITHPHGPTQSALSRAILDDAGVDPLDIDYVEMHGTGTQAGDGTEMVSVTDVFAPADRRRPADRPLYLGAVKANVGHGEAASGVTALIKVLLMLQKDAIPPHVGIKSGSKINQKFPRDLSERNVNIAFHLTPFRRRDGKPRRVFINNFSAAGGNTGLLLEDAPKPPPATADPRSHHLVTITAKSKAALIRNAGRLSDWMAAHPDTPVAHVAYSTTARKMQHYWRMSVVGADLADTRAAIQKRLVEGAFDVAPEPSKIAFLYTGQGSLYPALGKELYEHYSVFRQSIDEFDLLARVQGFPSFMPLIDGSQLDVTKLSPVVSQLGLLCFEMALTRLWASWGLRPDVVMGHSLGEYAALEAAGVFSAGEAIYLVGARAGLLAEKCTAGTHSMLAVQCSVDDVSGALGSAMANLEVACINGPRETVLSGPTEDIDKAFETMKEVGYKSQPLRVPFAFHSAQVDAILAEFRKVALGVHFQRPRIPVISPLLGKTFEHELIDAAYLCAHAREQVNFRDALVRAQESNTVDSKTVWLELGPHFVCGPMVKNTLGASAVVVPTLRRNDSCYRVLSNTLGALHAARVSIDFNEYHRDFGSSVRLLDLPSYSFDYENYWLQYEGDWCLIKNRFASLAAAAPAAPSGPPPLSTTTVQRIVKQEVKGDVAVIEIESDLCQEQLRNAVSGHMVNGTPLCPSSLYGDMAMTVCDYAYKLLRPDAKNIGFNVARMEVAKPLIYDDEAESQILRLAVTADAESGHADLVFHSGEVKRRTEHAKCRVEFGNRSEWQSEFDRVAYLIKGRINALMEAEKAGTASKIGRGLAYKLFSALVDYAPRYRGMEEVVLDSATCEATAKVRFQTSPEDGTFYFSPYHIDSLCHISGFIINSTDAVDSRESVYISHGWGSMRFTEIPDAKKEYRSYIRMQPVKDDTIMVGDAFVFDGDRVVGIAGNIKFQCIPRRLLNTLLPPRGAHAVGSAPARSAPAAKSAPPKKQEAVKGASSPRKGSVTPATIGKVDQGLGGRTAAVMDILVKEVGCTYDDLADNVSFGDLGVDSLMSLTVAGKVQEVLGLEIDSKVFLDHPTVGAFKGYLGQFEKRDRKDSVSSGDSRATLDYESGETESGSNITTPFDQSEAESVRDEEEDEEADEPGSDVSDLQKFLRETIAKEVGVEVGEVVAAPNLVELGIDSIMSLNITGVLREGVDMDIPGDLFIANQTLEAVERALGIVPRPRAAQEPKKRAGRKRQEGPRQPEAPPEATRPNPAKEHPRISLEVPAPPKPPRPANIVDTHPNRKSASILLSGNPRTAKKHLFMIPDGSGSPTSYIEIANVGGDWAVWGLVSPFLKTPKEYVCGVYGMATKFIAAMKERQPQGPYSLGGWSAGGVIAFEIVYQLVAAGEEVEHLIIIDAPSPCTIEPLPDGLHAWFASIGLLGEGEDKKIPEWLLPHFAASVTALSNYDAQPIPKEKCPKVMAIWCEDGVCKLPTDPRPEPYPKGHALFLLDNRTDFGPNRWDEYLDMDKMQFRHMPGNHFSMIHGEFAKQLGDFVREALRG